MSIQSEQREPGWEFSRHQEHLEVEGTLSTKGDLPIKIELDIKPKEIGSSDRRLLVCIHGSHSSGYEYEDVTKSLEDTNISVARITTSRHHDFNPAEGQDFFQPDGTSDDYMTTGFSGKTYQMEVEDVRRGINKLLLSSEEIFSVPRENLKLDILGSSLGSTIAANLVGEYKDNLESLILAAPPTKSEINNRPILDTLPPKEEFLTDLYLAEKVLLLRGADDRVVGERDLQDFENAASKIGRVRAETLPGGHTFGLFEFEQADREQTRAKFVERVKEFLLDSNQA